MHPGPHKDCNLVPEKAATCGAIREKPVIDSEDEVVSEGDTRVRPQKGLQVNMRSPVSGPLGTGMRAEDAGASYTSMP
jgi:hypothetical protein